MEADVAEAAEDRRPPSAQEADVEDRGVAERTVVGEGVTSSECCSFGRARATAALGFSGKRLSAAACNSSSSACSALTAGSRISMDIGW
mmetsp:Transcript_123265/g.356128  ORF Transcript_123265/g.356128 Transcript_123265/m.356128 type:complete len:89 (+) Transcript_123265:91-357(+)